MKHYIIHKISFLESIYIKASDIELIFKYKKTHPPAVIRLKVAGKILSLKV